MKSNKRGAISIEMIIAIIIAVVVLLLVVLYFTQTFERATGPVGGVIGAIECETYCTAKDSTRYCDANCGDVLAKLGKSCEEISC